MIDSAVSYMSSLQTSGENFTANEYVRVHILESLIVPDISNRTLATALKKESSKPSAYAKDDHSLELNAENL
jgi:hypothetical protein